MIIDLFNRWISLMDDCRSGLSAKEFNNRQKQIANIYRRMDFAEQGEFHHLIAKSHREWSKLS